MTGDAPRCRFCGRPLHASRSALLGVGPQCARALLPAELLAAVGRALVRASARVIPPRPSHAPSPDQLDLFGGDRD